MATMIPREMEEDNNSYGEKQVFEKLKKLLPPEYIVFHSVRWNSRNDRNRVIWGESDFTILHKDKGMIVIEVKSGGIECINNQWAYIRTDNHEKHPMKNPLKQADKSKYRFTELVDLLFEDTQYTQNPKYCYVESAVWFPSISKKDVVGDLPMEFHDEITLYENALDNPQKYIDGIYDYYNTSIRTKLDEDDFKKIIEAMAPHYGAMPSLKSKRGEQNEQFDRLTAEQNSLLDYLEEQHIAAIQGAAGTGKTWLAVKKAQLLAKDGKVLFLCFNQFLKEYLQGIKDQNPHNFENIDFDNLPSLACSKLMVPYVEKEDIIQFLKTYDRYNWDYKHIIIDEGQDFDDEQIEKLYEIAFFQEGDFYIFYDKNQFVQGKEFPNWLKNAECRLVLNINCRNTYSIAETAGIVVDVKPKVKKRAVLGDMPQFHICSSEKDVQKKLSVLIDKYRTNGFPYDQIVILSYLAEDKLSASEYESEDSIKGKSILAKIRKAGNHKISTVREPNSVLFTTVRKFKGLEADAVIFVDIAEDTFANDDNKRLFYVGTSRAKHSLDILYQGEISDINKIIEKISPDEDMRHYPNPIMGIAGTLKVKPVIR